MATGQRDPEAWLEGKASYPVYYEDTDFSGFVYHANYLKYFERGREDMVGIDYVHELYRRGIHFVVARMELSFHLPARHGDLVEVQTRMRLSDSPVHLVEQVATRIPRRGDGACEKLVSAKIKLVAVDNTGESLRLPADVLAYFVDLAARRA